MKEKGFIPIIFILIIIFISGGIVGGSLYIKAAYPEFIKNIPTIGDQPAKTTISPTISSVPVKETIKVTTSIQQETLNNELSDENKKDLMGKVAYYIDQSYQKSKKLPLNLTDIDLSLVKGLNQQTNIFVSQELKYMPLSEGKYNLCVVFKNQIADLPSAYFEEKIDIKNPASSYQCYRFMVFRQSVYTTIEPPISKTPGSITFSDSRISTITNDVIYTSNSFTTIYTLVGVSNDAINKKPGITKETGYFNFPYGFFSEIPNEWGLIGSNGGPVTVKIIFKNPTALKNISNLFSNCQLIDCYSWKAIGITKQNTTVSLSDSIVAGKDAFTFSSQEISSSESFKELDITVTRTDNTYDTTIVWKKIKIEYK